MNLYSEAAVRVSRPEQHAVDHRSGREGRKKCWADTLPWKSDTEEGADRRRHREKTH